MGREVPPGKEERRLNDALVVLNSSSSYLGSFLFAVLLLVFV